MSDPLNMSLDDIIKQKKTTKAKKPQVLGSKGKGRLAGGTNKAKIKIPTSPKGRVSRAFKGKLTKSLQIKNGLNANRRGRGRGGSRYFNSPQRKGPNYSWRQAIVSPSTVGNNVGRGGGNRTQPRRRQYNLATAAGESYQYQRSNRQFNRRRNMNTMPFQSFRNFNWQFKQKFARKSVNRARQMLIRRRILQNRGGYLASGRIQVGQFGLVTTQRQNIRERQIMIRNKILRARQIREGQGQIQNLSMNGLVFNSRGGRGGMQQQRQLRATRQRQNAAEIETWSSPSFAQSRYSGPRFHDSEVSDDWIPPLMTVRNSERLSISEQRNRARPLRAGLDPNIQRKIQYIQQQGKRNRRDEERKEYTSDRYLREEEEESIHFQPTIITSRMTLSDRFKSFMKS